METATVYPPAHLASKNGSSPVDDASCSILHAWIIPSCGPNVPECEPVRKKKSGRSDPPAAWPRKPTQVDDWTDFGGYAIKKGGQSGYLCPLSIFPAREINW